MSLLRYVAFAALALLVGAVPVSARSVLMISIDGLRADDLTRTDKDAANIPTLRALAANGVHARGVRNVLPTQTYPNHTTLITGVFPAKHGIVANVMFDPEGKNMGGWMWYSEDIRVPTLWDAVKAKGGTVASIGWPVSVGARAIDYNVPEFWRARVPEDAKLVRAVSTPVMPEEIAGLTGVPFAKVAYNFGATHEEMDAARMAWVPAMIARYKPQFMTLHIIDLDDARHKYGPQTAEARAVLETIDRGLGAMLEKVRAADPEMVVAIVSDHGFLEIDKGLNLEAALAAEGLITHGANGKVTGWSAFPWIMGGSAAIMLKDPADRALEDRVRRLLAKLAADPANGIDAVLERPDIARLGGTADASFWVSMKRGYSTVAGADKALVRAVPGRGSHGYSPDSDDMQSAFILAGPGIARKRLGVIDMRDIAPTIGDVLGAPMPQADGKVIAVR